MAVRNPELEARASAEGATTFADWYYRAINDGAALAPFYVSSSTRYRAAAVRADVTINGRLLPDEDGTAPAAYEALLREQRATPAGEAKVHYEVDSVDAQVVNANYGIACPEHVLAAKAEPRMSLLVQVGGWIAFGADKDAPRKSFSEVFVLVPNWDSYGRNAPKNAKRYLILSQNFRAL